MLNRDPSPVELQKYSKYTLDIIDIIRPKKICCFGRIPQNTIGKLLGKEFTYIPHPSRASYEALKRAYSNVLINYT